MDINFFIRFTETRRHVLMKSRAPMAAAGTIRARMEALASKSVSPPAFGTTVLVWNRLLENTARFRREVVKTTK